jgi:hypothetical protein
MCYREWMRGLRRFIRSRRLGGPLGLWVAYSLAIQAVMASVGLGMSVAAASGHSDFVICSFSAGLNAHAGCTAAVNSLLLGRNVRFASLPRKAPAML